MAKWYITRNGKFVGPFPTAVLKQLAATGMIHENDLIRRDGEVSMRKASDVKGLLSSSIGETTDIVTNPIVDSPEEFAPLTSSPERRGLWNLKNAINFPFEKSLANAIRSVVMSLLAAYLLISKSFGVLALGTNCSPYVIFLVWVGCIVVLPAILHPKFTSGSIWRSLAEVMSRTIICLVAAFFASKPLHGQVEGYVGSGVELKYIVVYVISGVGTSLLPSNLSLLIGLAIISLVYFENTFIQ